MANPMCVCVHVLCIYIYIIISYRKPSFISLLTCTASTVRIWVYRMIWAIQGGRDDSDPKLERRAPWSRILNCKGTKRQICSKKSWDVKWIPCFMLREMFMNGNSNHQSLVRNLQNTDERWWKHIHHPHKTSQALWTPPILWYSVNLRLPASKKIWTVLAQLARPDCGRISYSHHVKLFNS